MEEIREEILNLFSTGRSLSGRNLAHKNGYWMTVEEDLLHVSEMDTTHLENIKNRFLNHAETELRKKIAIPEEDKVAIASKNPFWSFLVEELNQRRSQQMKRRNGDQQGEQADQRKEQADYMDKATNPERPAVTPVEDRRDPPSTNGGSKEEGEDGQ